MPAPYSEDLRWRTVEAYANGEGSQREIAERFKISLPTFERYWRLYQRTGKLTPILEKSGRPSLISGDNIERVKRIMEECPDATLKEICHEYNGQRKRKAGISVMHRVLKKLGYRRKKKSHYAQEQERPDIKKSAT